MEIGQRVRFVGGGPSGVITNVQEHQERKVYTVEAEGVLTVSSSAVTQYAYFSDDEPWFTETHDGVWSCDIEPIID
jgi:hypothetical protein